MTRRSGRLAAAVRADEGDDAAGLDRQVDAVEDRQCGSRVLRGPGT